MSSAAFHPRLRLVHPDECDTPRASRSVHASISQFKQQAETLEVARENRLAAHAGSITSRELDPRDPRWVLAMQTQSRLQGAMLTPERRDELLRSSGRLGLRPFEANLVIAIVQDQARAGQSLESAEGTLKMIGGERTAERRTLSQSMAYRLIGAIAAAVAAAGLLILWLLG